ncbi:hypothetical protein QBC44DRAFT_43039 [Cladorrhinum sp. PSN332]|nr:hypothetical protein QBC44DRAFT_43039 [Cladorrhinum sp. PSN332]
MWSPRRCRCCCLLLVACCLLFVDTCVVSVCSGWMVGGCDEWGSEGKQVFGFGSRFCRSQKKARRRVSDVNRVKHQMPMPMTEK